MLRRAVFLALLVFALSGSAAFARTDRNQVLSRVTVGFRPHTGAAERARLLEGTRPAGGIPALRVRVVDVRPAQVQPLLARLRSSRAVAYAERDGGGTTALVPNDPFYASSGSWGFGNMHLPGAWSLSTGNASVVIGVLDTGVDSSAADLQGALLPGWDFANNDADPTDDHGHGTAVASVAAARIDNSIGVSGVCGACSILPVKIADSTGYGSWTNLAAGITWATDHGANILNISVVGPDPSDVLGQAVAYAQAHGVLVVAAAGNDGNVGPGYPAAYPGVISVAATDWNDNLLPFSNHGPNVMLAAPGCAATLKPGNEEGETCGTSVSSPIVAGIAGLLLSYRPGLSSAQLATTLQQSAARAATDDTAYGRVDALRALQNAPTPFASATTLASVSAPATQNAPVHRLTLLAKRATAATTQRRRLRAQHARRGG